MKSLSQKIFKIGSISLALFASIYLLVLLIVPFAIDANLYKDKIFYQVKKTTGFKIYAEDVQFTYAFSPYLNLKAYHVKVDYPDKTTLLKITDSNFRIKLIPLLFKKIEISSASIVRPIASLTLYSDLTTSLEKYIKNSKSENSNLGFEFESKSFSIKLSRYKLKIKDEKLKSPFILEGDNLVLSKSDFKKNIHLVTKGEIKSNSAKYITYDVDIERISLKDKNAKFFKTSPFATINKYKTKGNVLAHLIIDNRKETPDIVGKCILSNLNLNIEGKSFNNNYLKLLFFGNKIKTEASLYTNPNNPITIKGKITAGKKPYLDLNVKAIKSDLSKLQKLSIAILDSLNIENSLKDYTAKGFANFDFRFKSDLKKIESKGIATILRASIVAKKSPFRITNINSSIDFSNDIINIAISSALVNGTPINLSGSINSDAYANILVSGSNLSLSRISKNFSFFKQIKPYSITKGNLTFKAFAKGELQNISLNCVSYIKGLEVFNSQNNNTVFLDKVKISTDFKNSLASSKLFINDAKIHLNEYNLKLFTKDLRVSLQPKAITVSPFTIMMGNESILLRGRIDNYLTNPFFNFDFNGKVNSEYVYKIIKSKYDFNASAKGILPIKGICKGNSDSLYLNLKIMPDKDNYISFLVVKELLNKPSMFNVSLKKNQDVINLTDFSIYSAEESFDDFSINSSKANKLLSVKGHLKTTESIILDKLQINIPTSLTTSLAAFKGSELSVKSDLLLNGKLESPKILGDLYVNSLNIPAYDLSTKNAILTFKPLIINLKAPLLNFKGSNINLQAEINPKFSKSITVEDLKVIASNFDLNIFSRTLKELAGREIYPGIKMPLKINKGSCVTSKFKIGELVANNVRANLSLNNNLLNISNISASAYNGEILGDVSYDFLKALSKIKISGKNLDSSSSIYALTGIQDDIKGKLDLKANVSMYGYTREQHIKTLKGISAIKVQNGQMGALGKFEHFLYAQNLMSQNLMRSTVNVVAQAVASRNTGRFKYLTMDLSYVDGFAIVESLKFSGPNMSVYSTGKLNMLNSWGDFNILGKVSSEVVKVIGPFGDLSLARIVNKIPKLNEITLPNIFYKNYNLLVAPETIKKIPDLIPKTTFKTKNFNVKIKGNISNITSVKSFKWITTDTKEFDKKTSNLQMKAKSLYAPVKSTSVNEPKLNIENSKPTIIKKVPVQHTSNPTSNSPSFLDELPDDFN